MIRKAMGEIEGPVHAAGHYIYPGYMIKGRQKNLLIEAGVNILGPAYLKAIQSFFGGSNLLDCCFVTQSHYDHLGALPYLKRAIPQLSIGGSPRVAPLLQKEKVISTMNFLSAQLWEYFKDEISPCSENIEITPFEVDLELKDGDVIDLGGLQCEVYETPGHTRDHLSFFIPELLILFPGEALGNPAGDGTQVKVEFVTSYTDYVNSIQKLKALNPKTIAMSHMYVYSGDDSALFIDRTIKATVDYRDLIETYLNEAHGDIEAASNMMVKVEYDQKGEVLMERNAYLANLNAQIKAVHTAAESADG